jgi:hypothetical protein
MRSVLLLQLRRSAKTIDQVRKRPHCMFGGPCAQPQPCAQPTYPWLAAGRSVCPPAISNTWLWKLVFLRMDEKLCAFSAFDFLFLSIFP